MIKRCLFGILLLIIFGNNLVFADEYMDDSQDILLTDEKIDLLFDKCYKENERNACGILLKYYDFQCENTNIIIYCHFEGELLLKFNRTKEAEKKFIKNCNKNLAISCLAIANIKQDIYNNDRESLKYLEKGCSLNSIRSCHNAAIIYKKIKNIKKASELYNKCADIYEQSFNDNTELNDLLTYKKNVFYNILGNIYFSKLLGKRQNYAKSLYYYVESCVNNHKISCHNAGVQYVKGLGTEIDHSKAYNFFQKACVLQNDDSCTAVNELKKVLNFY